MPAKRKLSDGRGDEDSKPSVKKPKRPEMDDTELMQALYDTIRNHKTEDGHLLCEAFVRAPKRRTDPEYYNLVSRPIDLIKIQHKLKSDEYKSLDSFISDVETLVENAKIYYRPDTQEYQDACDLWELFLESKTVLLGEELAEYDHDSGEDEDDEDEDEEEDEPFMEDAEKGKEPLEVRAEVTNPSPEISSIVIPGTGSTPTIKLKMASSPPAGEARDVASKMDTTLSAAEGGDGGRKSHDDETPPKEAEPVRSLRERRYTYRDFLFPKVVISERQEQVVKQTSAAEKEMEVDEEKPAVSCEEDDTSYEELFAAVVTARDGERCISDMFKLLPSRKKYPDYYDVIQDPIDLRTIAQKIQGNEYKSLDEMVKDLNQMIHNAKSFNETGSQIYRDAVTLKKIVTNKKHELDQLRNSQHPVRSERIRTRKANAGQRLSLIIAAMDSDSDKEDGSEVQTQGDLEDLDSGTEASATESEEDPLWVLYRTVKSQKNSLNQRISEPFLRLPSRRVYPDYYEEIKKPMSLLKIQKKLKSGQYNDLDNLAADLDLVFENAKRYNMDESKLYKDAVRLQGVMNAKLKELKEEMWDQGGEFLIKPGVKCRRSLDASSTASGTSEEGTSKKKSRKSLTGEDALKKRLWSIYKAVYDYQFDGRSLINIFITLPSKKDYPDYYQVISEPIDMTIIGNKIQQNKYQNEKALIADLELMFNNARHYNEENSQVYHDAEKLERVLISKVRGMPSIEGSAAITKSTSRNKPKTKSTTTLSAKLQELYNTIRDYSDCRKRVLSTPFMKLPLKNEYPDYYEVIKRPMDMQKVFQRMMSNQYSSVEDMVSDMVLMFDNACKYNEPDSLIYKDALTLQRVCLEKKAELCADEEYVDVPDVRSQVQELLMNLFISTFSHTDEEGRCYSDSFMELPSKVPLEEGENDDIKERSAPTFEQVKRNLDKGRYRRADRFQEDMFEVFEFARQVSRTDSQVYEDSVEMQMFFIRIRDELCKNGEYLLTPALSFRESHLQKELELEREDKMTREQQEDEEKKRQNGDEEKPELHEEHQAGKVDAVHVGDQTYHAGDYVYIQPRDKGLDPHIVCIDRMWKEENGEQWLNGCWFLRPNETYHLATRKFLEKEVFRSDFFDSVPFSKVLGKCYVMFVKEYFKMKPEGIDEKDVFVCESRYSGRTKAFKKIKSSSWQQTQNDKIKIVPRDVPLSQVRVASVFAEKMNNEEADADDGIVDPLEKDRDVVILELSASQGAEEGCTYYEQYKTNTTWIKLGDNVYVKQDSQDKPVIYDIERIWTDPSGETYIRGHQFIYPSDVEHPPTRLFYKREVFRSSELYVTQVANITGRCAVMTHKDYITCRLTEIPETDVYICESKYIQIDRIIKKFSKPMKKPNLSLKVCDDEILFFRKPIIPHKEPSPLLLKASEDTFLPDIDNSTMDSSHSENTSIQGDTSLGEVTTPDVSLEKKKIKVNKNKGRNVSGYIVFAAEYRKEIAAANPDMSFGEISKLVGSRWKALDPELKVKFEDKAKIMAQEQAAKQAEADKAFNDSFSFYPVSQSPGGEHGMSPGPSKGTHPQPIGSGYNSSGVQYSPGQQVLTPNLQATPNMSSTPGSYPLSSVHGMSPGLLPQPANQHSLMQNGLAYQSSPNSVQTAVSSHQMAPPPPPRPPSPMFVSVPPKTQRLVHSEAYLRYIENLNADSHTVGNWDRSLYATQENTPLPSNSKLPVHWLANGVGHHENAVNALWALRDLMMKDALTISRTLEFSQL